MVRGRPVSHTEGGAEMQPGKRVSGAERVLVGLH